MVQRVRDLTAEQAATLRAKRRVYEAKRRNNHKAIIGHGYGKGCCKRCAGLPHRVAGKRCRVCGPAYAPERSA